MAVTYSYPRRAYVIELVLDADEAENIAFALGMADKGAQELFEDAQKIRSLNELEDD